MLEGMPGLLVLAIIVAKILEYLDMIDLFEVIVGMMKLTAGLLFAVGAFLVYLVTRRGPERKSQGSVTIATRTVR